MSSLFYFFSSLRRGDQSTVFAQCFLIVGFYLLDVDILMLGLEMPQKYVSCRFWSLICIVFFCNAVLVRVASFIFYYCSCTGVTRLEVRPSNI